MNAVVETFKSLGMMYFTILSNGFEDIRDKRPIHLSHFIPCNEWTSTQGSHYVIDKSTGDRYANEQARIKRLKCLVMAAATPVVHSASMTLNLANRIIKLVTFAHFWHPSHKGYSLQECCLDYGKDLLRVAFTPILFLGLELSAVYGVFSPNDGGKLFATFERCLFEQGILAPCLQPEPASQVIWG
jgi:hypothetical protein